MSRPLPRPPSAVLFDLDGTLIDTAPDFIRCLNLLRQEYELSPLPGQGVRPHVSDGARAMIRLGFGLTPEDAGYGERHARFLDLYETGICEETELFAGMDPLLEALEEAGVPWGIVTNKPVRFAEPLLAALGLERRCSALVCPDHVAVSKPDPEGLHVACQSMGADPGSGIYVGDHARDIEAGRNAGMVTVAVRYGYILDPAVVDLWQADHIVETVDELTNLLQ